MKLPILPLFFLFLLSILSNQTKPIFALEKLPSLPLLLRCVSISVSVRVGVVN